MKKIILIMCLMSSTAFCNDGYLKIMAEEIVANFQMGVESYNKTRSNGLPEIKHDQKTNYYFTVDKHLIEFSIADYLNSQILVDKKMKKINLDLKNKKIVQIFHFILDTAYADDETDVSPTKIILATLGSLSKNLEEVGTICRVKDSLTPFGMSTCKTDTTKNNMEKLKQSIMKRKSACNNISDEQARDPGSDLYTVTANSENDFKLVKEFIVKISESREKKVNAFFKDYLGTEDQKFESCVDIVTNGTVLDKKGGDHRVGMRNLNDIRLSPEKEEMKLAAVALCKNIEELRSCLIQVSASYNGVVNAARGNSKNANTLPSVDQSLNGNAIAR